MRVIRALRERRQLLNVTQEMIAQSIGVTRSMVANYESERNDPPLSLLVAWCRALRVSLACIAEVAEV